MEEEFFRVGSTLEEAANDDSWDETWDDLDAGYQPTSLWAKLFKRPLRADTEPPLPMPALLTNPRPQRPATAPIVRNEDDEDEWEWELALARARIAADEAA